MGYYYIVCCVFLSSELHTLFPAIQPEIIELLWMLFAADKSFSAWYLISRRSRHTANLHFPIVDAATLSSLPPCLQQPTP